MNDIFSKVLDKWILQGIAEYGKLKIRVRITVGYLHRVTRKRDLTNV